MIKVAFSATTSLQQINFNMIVMIAVSVVIDVAALLTVLFRI